MADIEQALEAAGWFEPVAALPSRAMARPIILVEAGKPNYAGVLVRKRLQVPRYERPEDIVEAFNDRFGAPRPEDDAE